LNENRGATPPGNRNHKLTEETRIKLQRVGTYALPNQWLGNEGRTGKDRYNSRNSNRAALQEKLKSTKPVFDRRMKTWLESAKMLQNQCLEIRLPDREVWRLAIKNDFISLCPDTPCTNQKDLHEERKPRNSSGLQDFLVDAKICPPYNTQGKPSINSSRAAEEEMSRSFFLIVVAQDTVVTFIQHFPPSSQNIPCIQPIIEKQPSKKLDPRDAFGFPDVKNGSTGPELSKLILIEVATQKPTLPPNKVPGILGARADGRERVEKGL
jgi:hypothetical protein